MEEFTEVVPNVEAISQGLSDNVNDGKAGDVFVDATWRSLFAFTTKAHIPILCAGLLLSTASGIVVPAFSLFLGKVFTAFAEFGQGELNGPGLVHKVSQFAVLLVGLAGASCALNGFFFMAWLVFGELQARNARDQLFDSMLQKDMAWYETKKAGISASIPRQQT